MKVWVRLNTHVHEGVGPGFPDQSVIESVDVFDHPVPRGIECEVQSLGEHTWQPQQST